MSGEPVTEARYRELQAQLEAAQAEVAALKKELAVTRELLHFSAAAGPAAGPPPNEEG